jgi:hypothetical protein
MPWPPAVPMAAGVVRPSVTLSATLTSVLGSALIVATFSPWLAALLLLDCAISFAGLVRYFFV